MSRLAYFILLFSSIVLTQIIENPIPWLLALIFGTYFRLKNMKMVYPIIRTFGIFTPFYNIYLFLLCFFVQDYSKTKWNFDKTTKHSKAINSVILIIAFMILAGAAIPLFF